MGTAIDFVRAHDCRAFSRLSDEDGGQWEILAHRPRGPSHPGRFSDFRQGLSRPFPHVMDPDTGAEP